MSPRLIMKMRVAEIRDVASDVRVFTLRHATRTTLPPPEPGAHVDVRLPDGKVRQYSLCGDPDDASQYMIAVKREPEGRGGSVWIHDTIKQDDTLLVSAPRNHFQLVDGAARYVLIAGGIGITPMLPMVRRLQKIGADYVLHYCSSEATPPFSDLLREICGPRAQIYSTALSACAPRRFDAAGALADVGTATHIYCCGPARLMDAVRDASAHWPEEQVHFEAFKPLVDENFVPQAFDLVLNSSGQRLHVPAEKSALDVLREAGVSTSSSCETGVCGSCACGYLSGEVIHRDAFLSPSARKSRLALCISRGTGTIVLDL
jgi:vanillate O-demethylase ferredoxin subunit